MSSMGVELRRACWRAVEVKGGERKDGGDTLGVGRRLNGRRIGGVEGGVPRG